MWHQTEQQLKLTCVMMDILHHMTNLQKEFQKSNLFLFEVPQIHKRYIAKISFMENGVYPGEFEDSHVTEDPIQTEDEQSQPQRPRRVGVINAYV